MARLAVICDNTFDAIGGSHPLLTTAIFNA
jgi:hypothetical protein